LLNTNAALYKASIGSTALPSYKNALVAIPLFGDQLPPSVESVTSSYDGQPVFIPAYGQNSSRFTLEVVDAPSNGFVRIDKGIVVFQPAFGFVGAVTFSVKCVDNDTWLSTDPVGFIIGVSEFLIDAACWVVLWLGVFCFDVVGWDSLPVLLLDCPVFKTASMPNPPNPLPTPHYSPSHYRCQQSPPCFAQDRGPCDESD